MGMQMQIQSGNRAVSIKKNWKSGSFQTGEDPGKGSVKRNLDVVADTEFSDKLVVALFVGAFEVTHQTAALTDQFQKTKT